MSSKKVDVEERERVLDLPSTKSASHYCFRQQDQSSNTSLTKEATSKKDSTLLYSSAASKVFGGRFSKSPEERVRILSQRKEDLLKLARHSFAAKQKYQQEQHDKKD
jgi:hypothetical protein